MSIPVPTTACEEAEQLAEALARSLHITLPTVAPAGIVVNIHVQASAVANSSGADEPDPEAAAAAATAPQHGAFQESPRSAALALGATGVRFYCVWKLPLHPSVQGIFISVEPRAWPRFALACLGQASVVSSGADFCGGPRRLPTLVAAESIYSSRWTRLGQLPPTIQYYLLR